MCAQRQIRLGPILDGGQPQLVQPGRLGGHTGGIGQRRATPQLQRLAQHRRRAGPVAAAESAAPGLGEPLKPVRVDVVGIHSQAVAGRVEFDRVVLAGQGLTQPRHLRLEGVGRAPRRLLAVQAVDQPLSGDHPARV